MSGRDQLSLDLTSGDRPPEPRGAGLPDEEARRRILEDLDTNLLVEAGAGSGKTHTLVGRMVALVGEGAAEVHEIAAVTFTRKAAGELRERFQEGLEAARREEPQGPRRERLERALHDLDRSFMGTIHAFCARLLRERPLEAGIDPGFVELTAPESAAMASRFWSIHLERMAVEEDPTLGDMVDVGLEPEDLRGLYEEVRENLDVDFPCVPTPPPDPELVAFVRAGLDRILDDAARNLPKTEPAKGWDDFQRRLRSLLYARSFGRWSDDRAFLDALADLGSRSSWSSARHRWEEGAGGGSAGHRVRDDVNHLFRAGGPARGLLDEWWAHRYPLAVSFALEAARALADHRRSLGVLDFHDLLGLSARLLRSSPAARRALGTKWRRVLVDEFQDTDPLQAEILFLLASEPDGAEAASWATAEPRPGALFVVGDPKQSIYRFRRADIALYRHVRERFESFGAVVELVANFRSGPPLARCVDGVFAPPDGLFAEGVAGGVQARFAPLAVQPREAPTLERVAHYVVDVDSRRQDDLADWEAEALAEWIAERVGPGGDRHPGDFLILTRMKRTLARYARALEARDLPVQVSGAGIGVEDEVAELRLLLEALIDPEDASLVVAVLVGLFFGVDHDRLLDHRLSGGSFDFRRAGSSEEVGGPVEEALGTLRRWWRLARNEPADVVVGQVARELGLLPHAASGALGTIRAGALAYALDTLRRAGHAGDTSLVGAVEALDAAMNDEEAEAPLEPGRSDVVRLMNLHKAKGLEAPVVVLAAPFGERARAVTHHVARGDDGRARGWLLVERKEGRSTRTLARPERWGELEASERAFERAESTRLLYVAATRAREELVIACNPQRVDASPWAALGEWSKEHGSPLPLEATPPPERSHATASLSELDAHVQAATRERAERARPGHRFVAATQLAKRRDVNAARSDSRSREGEPVPVLEGGSGPGGYAWGTAVHGLLEAAGRGLEGPALRGVARTLLLELDRPVRRGEPTETDDLLATVQRVLDSELWARARASRAMLVEVPFAVDDEEPDTPPTWVEGVIDLAFREPAGWVIVDYKTDRGDDPHFAERVEAYRDQVRLYGEAWTRITGEPVAERLLWFVRSGELESL